MDTRRLKPAEQRRMTRPDYGIDSPAMVLSELLIALVLLGAAFVWPHSFGVQLRSLEFLGACVFFAMAGSMLLYSWSGKLAVRETILQSISWRGDEMVLDVGCGRGLLLIGAAKRVPRGRAVGVDTWDRIAVTGNSAQAVIENATLEGVAARVDVREGDARQLPFHDASFDVVVSNFVIHEVNTAAEREQLVSEMARVLKPGGRVALVDFIFTRGCVDTLRKCGIGDARRVRLGGFGAWMVTILMLGVFKMYLVTGSK